MPIQQKLALTSIGLVVLGRIQHQVLITVSLIYQLAREVT